MGFKDNSCGNLLKCVHISDHIPRLKNIKAVTDKRYKISIKKGKWIVFHFY